MNFKYMHLIAAYRVDKCIITPVCLKQAFFDKKTEKSISMSMAEIISYKFMHHHSINVFVTNLHFLSKAEKLLFKVH